MTVADLEGLLLRMNEKTHLGGWEAYPDFSGMPRQDANSVSVKLARGEAESSLTVALDAFAREKFVPPWIGVAKILLTIGG